jgi:hypothetical protein
MADRFAIVPGPQKASTGSTRQITAGRLTRFSPSGSRPGPVISRSDFDQQKTISSAMSTENVDDTQLRARFD